MNEKRHVLLLVFLMYREKEPPVGHSMAMKWRNHPWAIRWQWNLLPIVHIARSIVFWSDAVLNLNYKRKGQVGTHDSVCVCARARACVCMCVSVCVCARALNSLCFLQCTCVQIYASLSTSLALWTCISLYIYSCVDFFLNSVINKWSFIQDCLLNLPVSREKKSLAKEPIQQQQTAHRLVEVSQLASCSLSV